MNVTVVVQKQAGEKSCSCYVKEDLGKAVLSGYGPTADAAVSDMLAARQEMIGMGIDVPELEMTFVYDLWAFFDKFPLNATAVAAWIGINPSLMRQYLSGARKPSKARMKQIEDGVRRIARQMADAPLTTGF